MIGGTTDAQGAGTPRDGSLPRAARTALVTGASSGIGRAIALALAAGGAQVWAVARRQEALLEVADEARTQGDRLHAAPADLTSADDVAALGAALASADAGLDVLVHAAALASLGGIEDAPVADLDAQYRANLRAPYALTRAVLPLLRARGGDIVFVSSTAALAPSAGAGAYAATKAGLRALADSVRQEVNSSAVRVLTVFPGRTATPMQEAIHAHEERAYRPERLMQPDDVAAMVVAALDLPRSAEVTEIAMRPLAKPV